MWIVSASMLVISSCLLVTSLASVAFVGQWLAETRSLGLTSTPSGVGAVVEPA